VLGADGRAYRHVLDLLIGGSFPEVIVCPISAQEEVGEEWILGDATRALVLVESRSPDEVPHAEAKFVSRVAVVVVVVIIVVIVIVIGFIWLGAFPRFVAPGTRGQIAGLHMVLHLPELTMHQID